LGRSLLHALGMPIASSNQADWLPSIHPWCGMSQKHLATYLNDHLAGAASALELLTHLEQTPTVTALKAEISADREELEGLMRHLGIERSRTRQLMGWLAEKAALLKLKMDDVDETGLHRLEALEALALGIEGKRALWGALASAGVYGTPPRAIDYKRLEDRADEQRGRVETLRLQAAQAVLTPS
jgi:hypothetical protein